MLGRRTREGPVERNTVATVVRDCQDEGGVLEGNEDNR